MTREEAIQALNMIEAHGGIAIQAKEMAIKALEQKPMIFKSSNLDTEYLEQCRQRIKEQIEEGVVLLPYYIDLISPQEPKTGHWKWVKYESNPNIGNWHCSECNRIVCGAITAANPVYAYKYCPNCGAKMEGNT